jgi:hypothetical protein
LPLITRCECMSDARARQPWDPVRPAQAYVRGSRS